MKDFISVFWNQVLPLNQRLYRRPGRLDLPDFLYFKNKIASQKKNRLVHIIYLKLAFHSVFSCTFLCLTRSFIVCSTVSPAFKVRPAAPTSACSSHMEGSPGPSPFSAPDFCRDLALFFLAVTPVVISEMEMPFLSRGWEEIYNNDQSCPTKYLDK